ncbi:cation diffusion facilitator family transporter [uncultured Friedmanniella sp.]|uniref:cation diffusion facilitator family transporter n=1 Tax=uncultured Friedmanniella sp. TaxID=335381 RepID=UPI0035CA1DC4
MSTAQAPPATEQKSGGSSSLRTVIIAFAANLLIAIAKTVASMVTGSASMLAEAAHSWADTGNEIFLLVAERRGEKSRDDSHPMGYGRETYVWSMFAAFGLFTAGAVVSIYHGISELIHPEEAQDFLIAYLVLAVSFVLEGVSFTQAVTQTRRTAGELGRSVGDHILNTSNPTLRAVFFEDAAALIGILLAGSGILLHQLSGSAVPDAIGSILVGVLLGVVAVVLIDRNRRFLVGENVRPGLRSEVLRGLLESPEVDRVTYLHLEFLGPGRLYLVAAIDMSGNDREEHLAVRLRRLERHLEGNDNIEEAVLTLATPDEASLLL